MAAKKKSSTSTPTEKKKETRAEKFVRLAQSRVSKAVKTIYNIGNLGGVAYESTPEQIEKITLALTNAVTVSVNRLSKSKDSKPSGFSL